MDSRGNETGTAGKLRMAVERHRAGDAGGALVLYREVMALSPKHPDALHLAGLALGQLGQRDESLAMLREALDVCPGNALFSFDLGRALLSASLLEEAIEPLTVASIEPGPTAVEALMLLGEVHRGRGDFCAAAEAYETACDLDPRSFPAHLNAGLALRECRDLAGASGRFAHAVALNPGAMEAHWMLGRTLAELGRFREAVGALRQAVVMAAGNAEVWYDLGNAVRATDHLAEAVACYERALALQPDYSAAEGNLGEALQAAGRVDDAISRYRGVLAHDPACRLVVSNLLLSLNYSSGHAREELAQEHRRLAPAFGEASRSHVSAVRESGRIRVGYVSPDFRVHSVAWFIEPVIANHDRKRFEVCCYSNAPVADERTERFREMAEVWRDIHDLTDQEAAGAIGDDHIDILVDLAGHTSGSRLGVFATRAAPVQVTYLGYPNTTGIGAMDYRVTDRWADPEGSDALHTESLVRLESGFLCYMADPGAPAPRETQRPGERIVLASFNNVAKISMDTVTAWATILKRIPGAVLLLKSRFFVDELAVSHIVERFRGQGVSEDRLVLARTTPKYEDHLAQYRDVDVALDTFPYNGTTTTCEALWMGVPVVTLVGARHAARVGYSILKRVGREELIAHSIEEYIEIAVSLAESGGENTPYGRALRDKMKASPLCDGARLTAELEEAFERMCMCRSA